MADQDECDYCVDARNKTIRSTPMSRPEALALYMRLQGQGYFPTMCENRNGSCRVCYGEQDRVRG